MGAKAKRCRKTVKDFAENVLNFLELLFFALEKKVFRALLIKTFEMYYA